MLCLEDQFKQGAIKDVTDANCNTRAINPFSAEHTQSPCPAPIVSRARSFAENLESEYQFPHICGEWWRGEQREEEVNYLESTLNLTQA